jgi:hypothetical protein
VVAVKRYLGGATTPRRTILPLVDGIASLNGPADLINDLLLYSVLNLQNNYTEGNLDAQHSPIANSSEDTILENPLNIDDLYHFDSIPFEDIGNQMVVDNEESEDAMYTQISL